jgi:hypothetical protein
MMIAQALLRTETERWREEYTISRPAGSYRWVLSGLGMTPPPVDVHCSCVMLGREYRALLVSQQAKGTT